MAGSVLVNANKLKKRKKLARITTIASMSLLGLITVMFTVLSIVYKGGNLTILLEKAKDDKPSLVIYEDKEVKSVSRTLYAEDVPFMDNISIKWLPKDIDTEKDGSHNGTNYIAYTFYVENTGDEEYINYWYEVVVDNVIKKVDDAVRIMIFVNGDKTIYAKRNEVTGDPEPNTTPFYEGEEATDKETIVVEHREKLKQNTPDRITIVVWLEGDDPECVNAIIGGEIKMHMTITEEPYDSKRETYKEKEEVKEEEDKKEEKIDE